MTASISKAGVLQALLLLGPNVTAFVPSLKTSSSSPFSSSLSMEESKKDGPTFFAEEVTEKMEEVSTPTPVETAVKEDIVETSGMPDLINGDAVKEDLKSEPIFDMKVREDLEALASDLNPIVAFYDPLKLSEAQFWSLDNSATVGFLRQAEIKHGRVAMAAFVGYCVQSNWHWPWDMSLDGSPFPSIDLSPEAQWDAIPLNAKLQIISAIGFLEFWDELGGKIAESGALGMPERNLMPHYTKGRMPGKYPSFQNFRDIVHWVPDLYDPAGTIRKNKKFTEEKKAEGRLAEINNGRLAMLGIMGFLAADKVPGAVPLLNDIAQAYDGNTMIPFANDFTFGFPPVTPEDVAIASSSVMEFSSQPIEVTSGAAAVAEVVEKAAEGSLDAQLLN